MANSISGRVTRKVNLPLAGIQVTATDAQNNATSALTATNGNYTIADLANGDYTVSVKAAGFKKPAAQSVTIDNEDVPGVDFLGLDALSITGRVTDATGAPVQNAQVSAINVLNQQTDAAPTSASGDYEFLNLADGAYTVRVQNPPGHLTARNVAVVLGTTAEGIDFSLNVVKDFLDRLDDARFSIESQISLEEANQAVALFSVVNLLLAGLSRRRVGSDEKIDVLGVLELYYGLQDGTLRNKITVADSQRFWSSLETELRDLARELDQLQADVDFLHREAKRQFNLGTSNNVLANVQFPALFKRYADIGVDPLLSLDIRQEEKNQFFDKAKLAEADDLLKELKGLILQIVRSLSKYGTAATKRVNEDWARFEARALEVLATVAQDFITPDLDLKNIFSLYGVISNKNRETQVAPYVVLARHGGKLLKIAMEVYLKTQDQLDNFDRDHLRDLFQLQGQKFVTTRLREEATLVKRYPLATWG